MRKRKNGYDEIISKDAENAMKKLVKQADIGRWIFVCSHDGYVQIVDIDYERGVPFAFSEGLRELERRLPKPAEDYDLTPAELAAYRALLREHGIH